MLAIGVMADQPEYLPEEPVVITADGLSAGETVEFQVRRVDVAPDSGAVAYEPWLIADGSQFDASGGGDIDDGGNFDLDGVSDGSVQTQWAISDDESPGGTYEVTATALASGDVATWQFTAREDEPVVVSSASVAVDKEDYQPGETAIVTATGFTPGETVEFLVLHIDGTTTTDGGSLTLAGH